MNTTTTNIETVQDAVKAIGAGFSISDADLRGMTFGFTFSDSDMADCPDNWRDLMAELRALQAALPAIQAVTRHAPMTSATMTRCDCGHTCPRSQAMTTSSGTACPDCYDDMAG